MVSKTKYKINDTEVANIFQSAGLGGISGTEPLGAGEYNAVFGVKAGGKDYAIKIAPNDKTPVLSYEKDMIASELYWYEKIRTNTPILVPEVYFSDFTRAIIPAPYFIMEKLPGVTLDQADKMVKDAADAQLATMAGYIHNIRGDGFGYIQMKSHDDWYGAVRAMTEAIIGDCAAKKKKTPNGERLIEFIDRHKDVLKKAECRMVNFDLWMPNVICLPAGDYAWIDPERGFWGDPVADFVCLETMKPFEQKTISMEAHNAVCDIKITSSPEILIRYAVALGYLGLIMEVEKYYRYTPVNPGWLRNTAFSGILFKRAFEMFA
jgi:aminoglycoside phosphotransferase (APT) family kinase protein